MADKKTNGKTFSFDVVEKVWEKARIIPGFDPEYLREDQFGTVIARVFYEECRPGFALGWRIVHIKSPEKGGTNDISNLQPMQWENNPGKPSSRNKQTATSKKTARKVNS